MSEKPKCPLTEKSPPERQCNTSDMPRPLTQCEKETLRQDMKESSAWAKAELKRRRAEKRQK